MTRDRRTTNPRRVVVGASHRPIQKNTQKKKKREAKETCD